MLLKESLTGNVRTALVVAASSSPDMIHETMSSLKFGISCGNIKTSVSRKTVNAEDQVTKYRRGLDQCAAELVQMEGRGWKGGFGDNAPKPTQEAFVDNYRKMVAE